MDDITSKMTEFREQIYRANHDLAKKFHRPPFQEIKLIADIHDSPKMNASYAQGSNPPMICLHNPNVDLEQMAYHELTHAFDDVPRESESEENEQLGRLKANIGITTLSYWRMPEGAQQFAATALQHRDLDTLTNYATSLAKNTIRREYLAYTAQYLRNLERQKNEPKKFVVSSAYIEEKERVATYRAIAEYLEQHTACITHRGMTSDEELQVMCSRNTNLLDALHTVIDKAYFFAQFAANLTAYGVTDTYPEYAESISLPVSVAGTVHRNIAVNIPIYIDRVQHIPDQWEILSSYIGAPAEAILQKVALVIDRFDGTGRWAKNSNQFRTLVQTLRSTAGALDAQERELSEEMASVSQ